MHHPTDRITHTTAFVTTPVVEHWLEREIAQWVHPMKDRSDDPLHHELHLAHSTSRNGKYKLNITINDDDDDDKKKRIRAILRMRGETRGIKMRTLLNISIFNTGSCLNKVLSLNLTFYKPGAKSNVTLFVKLPLHLR